MTTKAVIPDVALMDNTSQRLPCILVLDGSGSMAGEPIDRLNEGLRELEKQLKNDPVASQRVQLLVIRIGHLDSVDVLVDWTDASAFTAPTIEAEGSTPLGAGVSLAISKLQEQKARYKANGIPYNRPWLFALTDGEPTDAGWEAAADACKSAEQSAQLIFFGIGTEGANLENLARFTTRGPLKLKGLNFKELFVWLSKSVSSASKAAQGSSAQLPSPAGWASVST